MKGRLAEKVHSARIASGWSQVILAEKAGIPRSSISDIERGKKENPTIKTLWKLAHAMDMSVSDLLRMDYEAPNNHD